ncbi:MaoC family dehydratase N-terminal domain-containing protein [Ancylobacter sp. Lp-2]|uniref:MaoC family dehydratase n=1 Tax=Ancylobacter sp. Lp-2 TaxID=2881339 RepID=UPI001E47B10D|nr:MaoC family dehydratase [Ancylobacter sp. Lp-2]MCB4767141.1 MaoC family dehydratase N-terminal domain-containing protein [Ancylobacter sp. Lp-2]
MPVSARDLMDFPIPEGRGVASARDAMLYALSVGYGREPLDAEHLRRTQENGLVPTPTLANILAHPGPWMKDAGVDWQRLVHSEHRLTLHRPVPFDTPLVSRSRMVSVVDRGPGKGMFATFERTIAVLAEDDRPDAALVATILQTNACRGDGGCGSAGTPLAPLPPVPERAPDALLSLAVAGDAALLYRLNGDRNPLHSDPAYALQAGFLRPILHGLCSFGLAGYAIGRLMGAPGLADVSAIAARFTGVVYPGDTLEVAVWQAGNELHFRVRVPARDVTVLDHGTARLAR